MALSVGQQVWIWCNVRPGPFSEEPLVTIESIDGPISGFVRSEELKTSAEGDSVRAVVRCINTNFIEVWIKGSFFTTNGLTNVSRDMAIAA